ncbi:MULTISPECIES: hypothetical protein [unclassified Neisseria]|uniref:hypothetical protein n=1 Tax=unclassified Neisseria TaxID=2623750 RepID=UPI0014311F64|nr:MULTISPECIES: hypothetical protein [unclassified Neisseria]MBF0804928.1 hypothetical protein [Neisseria sp. 19428wB4_WF04]
MSYSSFKQAILLLAASEILLDAQTKAQIRTENMPASSAGLPAAAPAGATVAATH